MSGQKEEGISVEEFKHANISLILDSYNDIFSSFDARSFAEKSLSVDFLDECKRATRDKDETDLELILSMPKTKRNLSDEFKIKKRLRDHFKHHAVEEEKKVNEMKKEGKLWAIIGVLLIFGITYGFVVFESIFIQSILTVFEIPGWFLIWEGMSKILIDSRKIEPESQFYKKMSEAHIIFRGY
jgi:hypothetical protein